MTLQEAQEILHRRYQGDNQIPSSNEEDYVVRTSYLNDAINEWETADEEWQELFLTLSGAPDGDKTTQEGQTTYDTPTTFLRPVSALRIEDDQGVKYYMRIAQESVHLHDSSDSEARVYYVTGNPLVGYKIHLNKPVLTTGLDINYEFYSRATQLELPEDTFQMVDPYFAIYYALAQLYENDGQGSRANLALARAGERLQIMKRNNIGHSFMQDDSVIPDRDTALGIGGFGI